MKERRKRILKRLVMEELEDRDMLTEIAMASTGLTTNSYQDVYKAVVGTEIGGPGGVGMVEDEPFNKNTGMPQIFTDNMNTGMAALTFPGAVTGVGQITLTTGANTLGISSFAYPTAGPSRAGGTGNAAFGGGIAGPAADAALEDFDFELIAQLTPGKHAEQSSEKAAADSDDDNGLEESVASEDAHRDTVGAAG